MAQTTISRTGSFDPTKLPGLESTLRGTPTLPPTAQCYGSPTGFYVLWPHPGLTAPQITIATSVINAYVQPTDFSQLPNALQKLHQYIQLPSPTGAQTTNAVQILCKAVLKLYTGKDSLDGTDISS